jgi:hypothetical protein
MASTEAAASDNRATPNLNDIEISAILPSPNELEDQLSKNQILHSPSRSKDKVSFSVKKQIVCNQCDRKEPLLNAIFCMICE